MANIKEISLSRFKGKQSTIFTGRPEGKTARANLNLDAIDLFPGIEVNIIIPEGTTSFNPSFYLGLLFESYRKLGADGFERKYKFTIASRDPNTKRVIEKNLADGKRNALNSLQYKNAFPVDNH